MGTTRLQYTLWIFLTLLVGSITQAAVANHLGQVCATWGQYHWKTFDGHFYQLDSNCNHVLTSQCKSSYEFFNIQMRRTLVNNIPTISKVIMKLDGTVVELTNSSVIVDDKIVSLPHVTFGVSIIGSTSSITITAQLGIILIWNRDDSLDIELDKKYMGQTCGLCGNFDGIDNDFKIDGAELSVMDFADTYKVEDPTERCEDTSFKPVQSCGSKAYCDNIFSSAAFSQCQNLLDVEAFSKVCMADMCNTENTSDVFLCKTIAEFSRECVHAGGGPQDWRNATFCHMECPYNMEYGEYWNSCQDSCSTPQASQTCNSHYHDGCHCPAGTVFNDISDTGCIAVTQCPCRHDNKVYKSGESYSYKCRSCVCESGQWNCLEDCPGICSVEGGAHINTFDGKVYTFHGDCTYILAKHINGSLFTVLADLVKCGLAESRTCLRGVTLSLYGNSVVIKIQATGHVFVNHIASQLPLYTPEVSAFKPSSFYIALDIKVGLQVVVQLSPVMQVFIIAKTSLKGSTAGLCGNFNNKMLDDFKVMSGLVEGNAVEFANTWKTGASCPNIKARYGSPCSQSVSKANYAQYWCSKLTDPKGIFAACHSVLSPQIYKDNCMYDSCNCESSEDCMCAAVSSYILACSLEGVHITGWRNNICGKFSTLCPDKTVYTYNMTSCRRTCRSLSQNDYSCKVDLSPVDGCGCAEGTFMNEDGHCVDQSKCACYDKDTIIPAGQTFSRDGITYVCRHGTLQGSGGEQLNLMPTCRSPMVYFDCTNVNPGVTGTECHKSCSTLDMGCVSSGCVSGCMCPDGLVSDGAGGCINETNCPCLHNGKVYQSGQTLTVDCNTCYCSGRKFTCTNKVCDEVCSIYGDGHYVTFDKKRFDFSGDCEYTLLQDYCGTSQGNGSFRIITENVPCGTTGATCSKSIKIYLGNNEFQLKDDNFQMVQGSSHVLPAQVLKMGIYLVVKLKPGLVLMWDKKTSLSIKLAPQYQGQVCGLCGNYDGNSKNDFTTRSQETVADVLEFGNSWKVSSECPDAQLLADPCSTNRYREAWSNKQCSIITSATFQSCHSHVDPGPFVDSCVRDSCACDTGGDCECFCTAVASYAKACTEAGACINWRTPKLCPLFCDYYNKPGGCEWHYKPCGVDCMKTCRNPSGNCSTLITALEGCYPQCPPTQPYFDEDNMQCVAWKQCGCYDDKGNHYKIGDKTPSDNCHTCTCTDSGITCIYNVTSCTCFVNGKTYQYGDTIYNTTDGLGNCIKAECGTNGNVTRKTYPCLTTTTVGPTTTPFTFSTSGQTTTVVYTTLQTTLETTSIPTETTTLFSTTPKEVTSGPVTSTTIKATTSIGPITRTLPVTTAIYTTRSSTTTAQSTESPRTTEPSVVSTATTTVKATTSIGTTSIYTTSPSKTTAKPVETTTSQETTVEVSTTKPPKVVTTGQVTTSTTAVVETTTAVPSVSTTSPETTVVTSKPSVATTTTQAPVVTTTGTTAKPTETTVVPVTESKKTSTAYTQPVVFNTTTAAASTITTRTTVKVTTSIGPITRTLPGTTAIYTTRPSPTTVFPTSSLFTPTTTLCVCTFNGTTFYPGDMVYNVSDGLGWCLVAYCNTSCKVEMQPRPCGTTTPSPNAPSTTTTPLTTFESSTTTRATPSSPSTTTVDCYDGNTTRKNGESWKYSNCTTATCTNGKITKTPTACPTVQPTICANGRKAVQIYDDDGCCFHYECECVCSNWGGDHYKTFDGKTYTFNENCSYYLVKSIITDMNLTIINDHNYCEHTGGTSCSKALIVKYDAATVVLTEQITAGTATNVVYVNGRRVYPAFQNSVLNITSTQVVITLEIPSIDLKVVYRASAFSIMLSYTLFNGKTEGQCGTCDNSQTNDCRSPNGQVVSCSDSAGQWHVPGSTCILPTTVPPTATTTRPPSTTPSVCKPAICEVLTSSVFQACHAHIPPGDYVTSCRHDICNKGNQTGCSSLEAYATECSEVGVCIDWRNSTNGKCEYKCPSNKVYEACGPDVAPTCNNRYNTKYNTNGNNTKEGCYCPEGTTLFNSVYDVCVTDCSKTCVGPDGKPKQSGDTWISDCKNCTCDGDTMGIVCEPVECPTVQTPNCSAPGYQLVTKKDGCCTTQSCECNTNLCPTPPKCNLGFELRTTNGTCCKSYECVPKGVCVYNTTEYKPGSKLPTKEPQPGEPPLQAPETPVTTAAPSGPTEPGTCQNCYCGPNMDPKTKLNIITCTPIICNKTCSAGYEYQSIAGKCCGECVQRECVYTTPDKTTLVIKVNDTIVSPNNRCVQYTCEEINGQFVTKETTTTCPAYDPLNCEPGTETTDAQGCCKTCKVKSTCEVQSKQTVIEVNNCKTLKPVNMTYCAGHCGSSSMYSAAANMMMHQCECCQEVTTSPGQVELSCADGSTVQHSYTLVETCQCNKAACTPGTTSRPQRRRRR